MERRAVLVGFTGALALMATAVLAATAPRYTHWRGNPPTDVALATLLDAPVRWVDTHVRVEGHIARVCPRGGRWIDVGVGDGRSIRFHVGVDMPPFEARDVGRRVTAAGVVRRSVRAAFGGDTGDGPPERSTPRSVETGFEIRGTAATVN